MISIHDESVAIVARPEHVGAASKSLDDESTALSFKRYQKEGTNDLDDGQPRRLEERWTRLLKLANRRKISLALIQTEARLLDEVVGTTSTKNQKQQIEAAGCLRNATNSSMLRKPPLQSRCWRRQAILCSVVMSTLLLIPTLALFPDGLKRGFDGQDAEHADKQRRPTLQEAANRRLEKELRATQWTFYLVDQRAQELADRKRHDRQRLSALERDFKTAQQQIHQLTIRVSQIIESE